MPNLDRAIALRELLLQAATYCPSYDEVDIEIRDMRRSVRPLIPATFEEFFEYVSVYEFGLAWFPLFHIARETDAPRLFWELLAQAGEMMPRWFADPRHGPYLEEARARSRIAWERDPT